MINPENAPIDVEEQRVWAQAYREDQKLSWASFARASGISAGTLQPFVTGNYQGNNERVARDMLKFRQFLSSRAESTAALPEDPGYFETATSRRIRTLLQIAQTGRITVVGTGPGTGKTMTAREYQASVSNCWLVTMRPSIQTIPALLRAVMAVFGLSDRYGRTDWMERGLFDRLKVHGHPLIIIDEANHLSVEQIEQLRSWNDEVRVGLCLMGNEELTARVEGGVGHALARLNSRIAGRHVQNVPVDDDVDAFCDAWNIQEAAQRKLLLKVARSPAAGGLRECAMIVETAAMLAGQDNRPLSLSDLRDAQSTRSTTVRNAS